MNLKKHTKLQLKLYRCGCKSGCRRRSELLEQAKYVLLIGSIKLRVSNKEVVE